MVCFHLKQGTHILYSKTKYHLFFNSNEITDCAIFIVSIAKLKICFKTGKQTEHQKENILVRKQCLEMVKCFTW